MKNQQELIQGPNSFLFTIFNYSFFISTNEITFFFMLVNKRKRKLSVVFVLSLKKLIFFIVDNFEKSH